MDTISFSCPECFTRLTAPARAVGKVMPCPRCKNRIAVPDGEETDSYGMAGTSAAPAKKRKDQDRPTDEEWQAPGYAELPDKPRAALDKAREHARKHQWKKALLAVYPVYQSLRRGRLIASARIIGRPMSYCLTRWAQGKLEQFEEDDVRPSAPLLKVLRQSAEMGRWSGSFDKNHCVICEEQWDRRPNVVVKIKTRAGTAYLCCTSPTKDDIELVARVEVISLMLDLARALDPENAETSEVRARLPDWFTQLVLRDYNGKPCWLSTVRPLTGVEEGAAVVGIFLALGAAIMSGSAEGIARGTAHAALDGFFAAISAKEDEDPDEAESGNILARLFAEDDEDY